MTRLIDRVLAAFGTLSHGLNRAVARPLPGRLGMLARRWPVGVTIIVVVLVVSIARLWMAAAPHVVATAIDLHQPDYAGPDGRMATVSGVLADSYVETFADRNFDHIKQEGEDGVSWLYFLGTEDHRAGVIVSSRTPPDRMYASGGRATITGRLMPGSGGDLAFMNVPGFDAGRLPFPLSAGWVYEGDEFAQVRTAREGTVLFGGLALALVVGWAVGPVRFRRSKPDAIGATAGAAPAPDRAARATIAGAVDRGGGHARTSSASISLPES